MANVSSFSGAMPVIPGGEVEVARVTRTDGGGGAGTTGTSWATGASFFASDLTFVADGTSTYIIEFYAPLVYSPTVAQQISVRLSTSTGTGEGPIVSLSGNAAAEGQNGFARFFVTPSAGAAVYNVRITASTGTGQVYCGTGGAGLYAPAYLRAIKIVNQNDGLKPFWTPPVVTSLPSQATVGDQVVNYTTGGAYQPYFYTGATDGWKQLGTSKPPMCRVYRNAALSQTASGSYQSIAFDTQSFDTDETATAMWVSGSPTRITFNTPGVYLVSAQVVFPANATGIRGARIFLNNSTIITQGGGQGSSTSATAMSQSTIYSFVAGDYIEALGFQDTGASLAYNVGVGLLTMSALWVGKVT